MNSKISCWIKKNKVQKSMSSGLLFMFKKGKKDLCTYLLLQVYMQMHKIDNNFPIEKGIEIGACGVSDRQIFYSVPFCCIWILNRINSLPIKSFKKYKYCILLSNIAIGFNVLWTTDQCNYLILYPPIPVLFDTNEPLSKFDPWEDTTGVFYILGVHHQVLLDTHLALHEMAVVAWARLWRRQSWASIVPISLFGYVDPVKLP